jgi:hypothetical protein
VGIAFRLAAEVKLLVIREKFTTIRPINANLVGKVAPRVMHHLIALNAMKGTTSS